MKAINKFSLALLLVLLAAGFSGMPSVFAMETEPEEGEPVEVTEEVVDDDEAGTVIDDLGSYRVGDVLVAMKDADVLVVRMKGVLDRYDGTGHPDDCDDFVEYYSYLDLYNEAFSVEIVFAPNEWTDVLTLAVDGTAKGLNSAESVFYLCQNGYDNSISTHNLNATKYGLDMAHEILVSALKSTAARAGVDPELVPSSIVGEIDVDLSPEELDYIAELLGLEWDQEVFYEDLLITSELLNNLGGWLDRLIAGQTVGCGEYFIYMLLLTEPVFFVNPPPAWKPLYQEHLAIINSVFDSNQELIDICINDGGKPNEFIVFKARAGISRAQDRLHWVKQTSATRLGIPPQ